MTPACGDGERYPLATIWDSVPLFETLDAIAIAQPTPSALLAVRRFADGAERYLNRGLRPVPGYSPYPGDRERDTETWFDDNGWWGIAFMQAYRATGAAQVSHRRRTGAALHLGRRLGSPLGRDLVEHHPPLQGRRGDRVGDAAGDADLRADRLARGPGDRAQVPGVGGHGRLQRRGRPLRRQQHQPDADRLHRGAADLRPGGAVRAGCAAGAAAPARERLKRTALTRFGSVLDFSPQYDAIYLQWMLALYSLDHDPALYDLAAANAREAYTALRQLPGPVSALMGRRSAARRSTRRPACSRPRRPPPACSPGWRCTRRPPSAAQAPIARRASLSKRCAGSSRLPSSIAAASRPIR